MAAAGDQGIVMGYFSNGTESLQYEDRYCQHCKHCGNCAVWDAHIIYGYEECNNPESILELLIPRSKDRLLNLKCKMFISSKTEGEK